MAGFNFGSMFPDKNEYDDGGRLKIAGQADMGSLWYTQVFANANHTVASTLTIYTVPAGKVLFVHHYNMSISKNVAGAVTISFDKSGAVLHRWDIPTVPNQWTGTMALNLTVPIKFIAGETVQSTVSSNNVHVSSNVQGWLEDA